MELLASSSFTDESLCYLDAKISEHRKLLLIVFPGQKLKPKHHFLEHYAHLIRCFGPLVDFWTLRFEAKHSFFKKLVRDVNNFKNILLTLSLRHELMLAYYMDMPSLFKPTVEVKGVSNVSLDILASSVKQVIEKKCRTLSSVSLATTAYIHGTRYTKGMFVSVGQSYKNQEVLIFLRLSMCCLYATSHSFFLNLSQLGISSTSDVMKSVRAILLN